MPGRLVAVCSSALLAISLAGCGLGGDDAPVDLEGGAELAVTVDTNGDDQQERAGDIARRYAPDGTFTVEQETGTTSTTGGDSASRTSTVVVFKVEAHSGDVIERLQKEPYVLKVVAR